MKQLTMLLVFLYASLNLSGQTTIYYRYDVSGNRTARDIVLHPSKGEGGDSDANYKKETDVQQTEVITDKIGETTVLIYPNPTESKVTVEIQGLEENKGDAIYLYDQSGRLVKTLNTVTLTNALDLSNLKTGIYFMVIRLKGGTTKWNIIKE